MPPPPPHRGPHGGPPQRGPKPTIHVDLDKPSTETTVTQHQKNGANLRITANQHPSTLSSLLHQMQCTCGTVVRFIRIYIFRRPVSDKVPQAIKP